MREALETLILLAAPMMPHLAEECWAALGHTQLLVHTPWPVAQADLTRADHVTIIVQVNGKRRGESDRCARRPRTTEIETRALALEAVQGIWTERPCVKWWLFRTGSSMWWSRRQFLVLACVALLMGCGFQPLYGNRSQASQHPCNLPRLT